MGYQKSLFPSSGQQIDYVLEANAREIIEPVERLLYRAVMDPWDDFLMSRREDKRFLRMEHYDVAQWMSHQIKCSAIDICEQNPDARLRHRKGKSQEFFELGGEVAIVFKKITLRKKRNGESRLERSNNLTKGNRGYWHQDRQDGVPDIPRFIVGYELLREMTDIRVFLGYPRSRGRTFVWIYELEAYSQAIIRPAAPPAVEDVEAGFTIKTLTDAEESGAS